VWTFAHIYKAHQSSSLPVIPSKTFRSLPWNDRDRLLVFIRIINKYNVSTGKLEMKDFIDADHVDDWSITDAPDEDQSADDAAGDN
jgi:hypothetical protein